MNGTRWHHVLLLFSVTLSHDSAALSFLLVVDDSIKFSSSQASPRSKRKKRPRYRLLIPTPPCIGYENGTV